MSKGMTYSGRIGCTYPFLSHSEVPPSDSPGNSKDLKPIPFNVEFIDPESHQVREVYAHFGLAMYYAQGLERAVALATFRRGGGIIRRAGHGGGRGPRPGVVLRLLVDTV